MILGRPDLRGNWLDYRWVDSPAGTPVPHQQTRTANGVNAYSSIDPDGPGDPPSLPPVTPAYDAAGNMMFDPLAPNLGDTSAPSGQRYEYDEENRVVAVCNANGTAAPEDDVLLAQYEYDALGRRVLSIEDYDASGVPQRKTRHVYVGLETIEEYECGPDGSLFECSAGGGAGEYRLVREFLWGDPGRFPEPVAMIDYTDAGQAPATCSTGVPPVGCVYHYLHDVLGSVVGLTDAEGALVERYTYDPYGRTLIEKWEPTTNHWQLTTASGLGNPWMWTGQRYDAGTGLYAFLYRSYSPGLGRWLQRDPIGYADGVNLYAYAMSNPLFWIDPFGLEIGNRGAVEK